MANKPAPPVTPLKRTAIFVRDMQRSLDFYQGVLGMNIWVQGTAGNEFPAMFRLSGLRPGKLRWVILQSDDVPWGMVGLFEIQQPKAGNTRHSHPRKVNYGEACLVFHTPNVRSIHRQAKRMKLPILCGPTRFEIKELGVLTWEMTLRDPNGVLVNLIQSVKGGSVGQSNRFPGIRKASRGR